MADCLFCRLRDERDELIGSNSYAYAVPDGYALTSGHVLVIPVRHVGSVFELKRHELEGVLELARDIRARDCDGYTIGINDGPAAGQTIPHMHLHIIPRRFGDVPNPRGGIRRIFPDDPYSQED